MGIIDRIFKKGRKDPLLEELVAFFGLEEKKSPHPWIMGNWHEGEIGALPLAITPIQEILVIHVGQLEECAEVLMERAKSPRDLPPPDSGQRLDRIAGPEGAELARNFYLIALPESEFDHPELRLDEVRDNLLQLSKSVYEIAIFATGAVSLSVDRDLAVPAELKLDVVRAAAIAEAIEAMEQLRPSK